MRVKGKYIFAMFAFADIILDYVYSEEQKGAA